MSKKTVIKRKGDNTIIIVDDILVPDYLGTGKYTTMTKDELKKLSSNATDKKLTSKEAK